MRYFSISSVEEAYHQISATTKEKFWGILGILHSIDETVYPNKYYSIETGKLSQYFEDLFRLGDKKVYSGTDEYSFVFSTHWVDIVAQDYLEGRPNITPILVWAYRNHSFDSEISITELFNKFLKDYHISKESAEQLFRLSFTDTLVFADNFYSDDDLLLRLGGVQGSQKTTIKLGGSFAVANPGDLSRGPYFQPLYAALQTLKCLTIYPFNINEYYNPEDNGVQEGDNSIKENKIDYAQRQVIYYGAPGTGKSNTIKRCVDDQHKTNFRVTFHPDSDYSTFVGCYKPGMKSSDQIYSAEELAVKLKEIKNSGVTYPCHKFAAQYWRSLKDLSADTIKQILIACGFTESMNVEISKGVAIGQEYLNKDEDGKIIYTFVPQAFTKAYTAAWNTEDDVYLIIEEINRGNCAQIFGDLFQLLDRKDGFSEYPVDADSDLADHIQKALSESTRTDFPDGVKEGKKLVLPSNLYIWATMNTSDQSLFPIDSAFKRRWDWKYVPIANAEKGWKIDVDGKSYDWWDFLEKINKVVGDTTNSEDKKLGYFFCKANGGIIDAETFVSKVVFYLWNDVFKDFPEEAGNVFKDADGSTLSFNKFYYVENGITKVKKDKVKLMLENLKVSNDNGTIDTEEMENDAAPSNEKNYLKEIVFPDGAVFSAEKGTFEAYLEAVKKIGVEKIGTVVDSLKYRRRGRPLISREKYEELDGKNFYSYYQVGDYFFVKGAKTYTYVRILEDLNNMLNLGMTIRNR
ncbi:MAG: hypothetical protein II975_03300 [Bacteroidales bacterium]|nr:hypothetical protein [Bacteroidales bacterium]